MTAKAEPDSETLAGLSAASGWLLLRELWRGVARFGAVIVTAALCSGLLALFVAQRRNLTFESAAQVSSGAEALRALEASLKQDAFLGSAALQARLNDAQGEDVWRAGRDVRQRYRIVLRKRGDFAEIVVAGTDAEAAADLANALAQKWLQESVPGERSISTATAARQPLEMGWLRLVSLAVCITLVGGALLAGLFELWRAGFREPGEIAAELQLRELGAIPHAGATAGSHDDGNELTVEALRGLLQAIWSAGTVGRRPRVLVVSSPAAADGRTSLATKLAVAFARTNRWVLLLDTDVKSPLAERVFGLDGGKGLSAMLREETAVEDYRFRELFQQSGVPGLSVLPAGQDDLEMESAAARARFEELVARARLEFHTVIIDAPAGALARPVSVLRDVCDGAVLVFRAERTSRWSARRFVRNLEQNGVLVLGAVLNDCDAEHF